ncbi:MAG TPA: hypothetical protein VK427_17955, partial [Kofleriaceae bacterium]|nr:hypothetical protein [Kofleriaceae bacterium]
PTPSGAALFSVPLAGGALRGFAIDSTGKIVTKEAGTVLREDRRYHAVAAAFAGDRLVTAVVTDDASVVIDHVREDLGASTNLVTARGYTVADVPMTPLRQHHLAAVGGDEGVSALRFDATWAADGTHELSAVGPRTVTATSFRDDTMVAWSTGTSCHLARIGGARTSARPWACEHARIAVDSLARRGYMVFEAGEKVMISEIVVDGESELANVRVLLDGARAPKIVFDGERYWISYLNVRDDVVVGYLGAGGTLVSMALEGTQPMPRGYELAILDGSPWVFAVDGNGANAQQICLKALY